jgi:hypothetical protein
LIKRGNIWKKFIEIASEKYREVVKRERRSRAVEQWSSRAAENPPFNSPFNKGG